MKQIRILSIIGLFLVLYSCSTPPPAKGEILQHLVGEYCSEDGFTKLKITGDSTFYNIAAIKSPISGKDFSQSCSGKFKLEYSEDEGKWWLNFLMRKTGLVSSNCSGKQLIWENGIGYKAGGTKSLNDPMQKVAILKSNCKGD